MNSSITATRYHDFSAGHRVYGHESKCAYLHGHNYRVHFTCSAPQLDQVGRVLDFSAIKDKLCMWVEENWDHRMLLWQEDPLALTIENLDPMTVIVPFNPTAENMARALLEIIGPKQLEGTNVTLTKVVVEETRKCSAAAVKIPDLKAAFREALLGGATGASGPTASQIQEA